VVLPLDTRQASIARALLVQTGVASLDQLAADLKLTHRVVRYNLPAIEAYLRRQGVTVRRRRGVGVWADGDPGVRQAVAATLASSTGPAVLEPSDRQSRTLLALLEAAPEALRSEVLEGRLGISRPTVRRDVRAAETWLEQHRLHVRRLPGVGIAVRGSEVEVRSALLALVLEAIPANRLAVQTGTASASSQEAIPAGLESWVAGLDLPTFRSILAGELVGLDEGDPTVVTATVSLAILVHRVRANRPARLVRGRLRSLLDHPVSESADRIADAITGRLGIRLAPAEVAAITESLLGFVELTDPAASAGADLLEIVDRVVQIAALRLHPSLAEDQHLRANLTEHLRRLQVRIRYGLPVSNPLQLEVRKRYPDVYDAAAAILAAVGSLDGTAIPTEEVGFLTMYLAGSLERHRLRPKIQVTVVCPAGMATAWILVSRLLAEFPQLEVARVVSKTAFQDAPGDIPTDIVVSTVPLDGPPGTIPWLVVSPLLDDRDVRRLARLVGVASQY
jgi:transcriptional antiterminator